jgi:hypothetical protein
MAYTVKSTTFMITLKNFQVPHQIISRPAQLYQQLRGEVTVLSSYRFLVALYLYSYYTR